MTAKAPKKSKSVLSHEEQIKNMQGLRKGQETQDENRRTKEL